LAAIGEPDESGVRLHQGGTRIHAFGEGPLREREAAGQEYGSCRFVFQFHLPVAWIGCKRRARRSPALNQGLARAARAPLSGSRDSSGRR
jgi:hypothetical protein